MEKLARGLARVEEGRKGELRGGSGDGGGHGDGGGVPGRRVGWGLVLGQEKRRVRGEGASARRKGEGRGELQGLGASVVSGIEGQRRLHGVVAERSSGGGVRRSRGSAAVQAGAQQGGAIMAEAASRLHAGRADRGVLGSALRKQGSRAEEGERREGERES